MLRWVTVWGLGRGIVMQVALEMTMQTNIETTTPMAIEMTTEMTLEMPMRLHKYIPFSLLHWNSITLFDYYTFNRVCELNACSFTRTFLVCWVTRRFRDHNIATLVSTDSELGNDPAPAG